MVKSKLTVAFAAPILLASMALSGCWDAESNQASASNSTGPVDFSTFTMALVTGKTCDATLPVEVDAIQFTFASDQDTADPTNVDTLTQGCTG